MRLTTLLLVVSSGCAGAASAPASESPPTTIRESPLPSPLPAGRWAAESTERTSCIDCPTAAVAVVLAVGDLEELGQRSWPELAPGYPLYLADGELGFSFDAPVGVVAGLYASAADGEVVAERLGARVLSLEPRPALGGTTIVTTIEAIDARVEPEGAVVRCSLPEGRRFVVQRDELWQPADQTWWLPVACASGAAFVPVTATDFDRTTLAADRVRTIQPVSGVCGVRYYRERTQDRDGGWSEAELSSDPSCVAELDPSDRWAVCPERTLGSCVARASELRASDPTHAERLMSYACRFGQLEGCSRLIGLNVDRGLGLLWGWCQGEHEDSCERLDAALRTTDPTTLQEGAGGLELYACERGLEPWCQRLDASPVCDRQGCG